MYPRLVGLFDQVQGHVRMTYTKALVYVARMSVSAMTIPGPIVVLGWTASKAHDLAVLTLQGPDGPIEVRADWKSFEGLKKLAQGR